MKKLWLLVATTVALFGLTACSKGVFDQQDNLKQNTNTVLQTVKTERTTLNEISAAINAFPSTVQSAYDKDPSADLASDTAVAKLIKKRDTAYAKLEKTQEQLVAATNVLIKISNQDGDDIPATKLKNTITGLRLSRLDHRTYDSYYKELLAAEKTFFSDVKTDPATASVDAALTRLNQYIGSLSQQSEIVTANLQTVTQEATSLQKAVAKLNE